MPDLLKQLLAPDNTLLECTKCGRQARPSDGDLSEHFHKSKGKWASQCKSCVNEKKRKRSFQDRLLVLQHYAVNGHIQCSCSCGCSESNLYVQQLDHVDGPGAGADERRLMAKELKGSRGNNIIRYCIKTNFKPKLRLLCASCHASLSAWGACYKEIERQRKLEIHGVGK